MTSVYQDMRKYALTSIENAAGMEVHVGVAVLLAGVVYALLAIAAAISDLKP